MQCQFEYQAEKFSQARACLMLPFSKGESVAIAEAFENCALALHRFDRTEIGDHRVHRWLAEIDAAMDISTIAEYAKVSKFQIRAGQMTFDEKLAFSHNIRECAAWFENQWVPQGGSMESGAERPPRRQMAPT
jgi:hypothetical protein